MTLYCSITAHSPASGFAGTKNGPIDWRSDRDSPRGQSASQWLAINTKSGLLAGDFAEANLRLLLDLRAVELRQGDMYALPLTDRSADSIILHQVLHYAQQPGAAISEASRVLRPGGRLLVIDFAQHEREELREQDAHLRLGFADDAMRGWFQSAGLELDRTDRLEGGELTVILWRGRKAGNEQYKREAA